MLRLLLLLLVLQPAWADRLASRIVARLPSPDGRATAWQKDFWSKSGPGPQYPVRCEIWLGKRLLHTYVVEDGKRRQAVKLSGWTGSTLVVTRREWPYQKMTDDALTSLRSECWLFDPAAPGRMWRRGLVPSGAILDQRGSTVLLGLDGEVGGGAGYPPFTSWKTLVWTDLEGTESHRLTGLEVDDDNGGGHFLSPNGEWVAFYAVAPSFDYAALSVCSRDGKLARSLPPGSFPYVWQDDRLLRIQSRLYDVVDGRFR